MTDANEVTSAMIDAGVRQIGECAFPQLTRAAVERIYRAMREADQCLPDSFSLEEVEAVFDGFPALSAAPRPIEAEPVAWRFWHEGGWNYSESDPSRHLANCVEPEPLYAAPPVQKLGSSPDGDPHRAAETAVVGMLRQMAADEQRKHIAMAQTEENIGPHRRARIREAAFREAADAIARQHAATLDDRTGMGAPQ